MNLGMYIERSAHFWPDRPAVLFPRALDYAALERRSNQLAHALLKLGLQRGDRVAVVSPNRPKIVELECALYKVGLVKVALNARLGAAGAGRCAGQRGTSGLPGRPRAPRHGAEQSGSGTHGPEPDRVRRRWRGHRGIGVAGLRAAAGPGACSTHIHVEMRAGELAVLHYTSGSTGRLARRRCKR